MTEARRRLIDTLDRLASTQRNLPVPLTEQERTHLREAARRLRALTPDCDVQGVPMTDP